MFDRLLQGTRLPVSVQRFYNSKDSWVGLFGAKNRISLGNDVQLNECDELHSRCLIGPSGYRARFSKNPDGSYKTPYGLGNVTLKELPSGRFELTDNASFAGQVTAYGYDANGNRANRTTGSHPTTYVFDKLNRKTSETFPGSLTHTYGYDKGSNLTTLTDPTGTSTYAYDDLGRTSSIISPTATTGTDTVTYAYTDPAGGALESKVVQTLPSSGTITTVADLSGKTKSVTVKNPGATQTLKRSWLYTRVATGAQEHDLVDTRSEFDGASTTPDRLTVYGYDQAGELTDAQTATGAGANIRYDALTYDAAGNRTSRVRTDGAAAPSTTTYAYNAQNQLCWRANVAVATPVCNSGIPSGATQYTYDAAGNQLTGDQTATWDAKSRLASLAGASATFLTTNNSELTALGTTSFHENVLGTSRITNGTDVSKIVRSADDGSAVSQVRAGVKQWFVTDNLGSTVALTDGAGGINRRYDYDIDGNDTTTGTGNDTWFRYAGGHLLPGTGSVYHFGARFYSPQSARWTQADPMLQPGDLANANRYAYAGNCANNYVDPQGTSAIDALLLTRCLGALKRLRVFVNAINALIDRANNNDSGTIVPNAKRIHLITQSGIYEEVQKKCLFRALSAIG